MSNELMIENTVIAAFNKAVTNPENLNEDEVDGINWNYVDADVHMDVAEIMAQDELHFVLGDMIEALIEEYIEFGKVEMMEAA